MACISSFSHSLSLSLYFFFAVCHVLSFTCPLYRLISRFYLKRRASQTEISRDSSSGSDTSKRLSNVTERPFIAFWLVFVGGLPKTVSHATSSQQEPARLVELSYRLTHSCPFVLVRINRIPGQITKLQEEAPRLYVCACGCRITFISFEGGQFTSSVCQPSDRK